MAFKTVLSSMFVFSGVAVLLEVDGFLAGMICQICDHNIPASG